MVIPWVYHQTPPIYYPGSAHTRCYLHLTSLMTPLSPSNPNPTSRSSSCPAQYPPTYHHLHVPPSGFISILWWLPSPHPPPPHHQALSPSMLSRTPHIDHAPPQPSPQLHASSMPTLSSPTISSHPPFQPQCLGIRCNHHPIGHDHQLLWSGFHLFPQWSNLY